MLKSTNEVFFHFLDVRRLVRERKQELALFQSISLVMLKVIEHLVQDVHRSFAKKLFEREI